MGGIAPEERTIARFVRSMESEDLAEAANLLRDLKAHPGWVMLQRLVTIETERLRRAMELKPLESLGAYAHANGAIRGLRLPSQIIDDTLETAREVRAVLEAKGD